MDYLLTMLAKLKITTSFASFAILWIKFRLDLIVHSVDMKSHGGSALPAVIEGQDGSHKSTVNCW